MKNRNRALILALAVLIAVSALAIVAWLIFRSTGPSGPATSSPSTAHASGPATPGSSAAHASGPATVVRVTQWTSVKSNPADSSAPILVSISLTVVPGTDLASGNLEFAFIPYGSSAVISPQLANPAPGPTFDPTSRLTQSFSVSFLMPTSVSSGTLVVSLPAGSELYRQQLSWIVPK